MKGQLDNQIEQQQIIVLKFLKLGLKKWAV